MVYCQRALGLLSGGNDPLVEAATLDGVGYALTHWAARRGNRLLRNAAAIMEMRAPYWQVDVLIHLGDACQAGGEPEQCRHAWQEALAIMDDLIDCRCRPGPRQAWRAPHDAASARPVSRGNRGRAPVLLSRYSRATVIPYAPEQPWMNAAILIQGPKKDRVDIEESHRGRVCCCHAEHFTETEIKVLCLLADGLSNSEIASHLSVSGHTVDRHVTQMCGEADAQQSLPRVGRLPGRSSGRGQQYATAVRAALPAAGRQRRTRLAS